jgi:hypothetical protein
MGIDLVDDRLVIYAQRTGNRTKVRAVCIEFDGLAAQSVRVAVVFGGGRVVFFADRAAEASAATGSQNRAVLARFCPIGPSRLDEQGNRPITAKSLLRNALAATRKREYTAWKDSPISFSCWQTISAMAKSAALDKSKSRRPT